MYFPSLYFWDDSYALSCPTTHFREKKIIAAGLRKIANIFPAECGAALAAINVSDSMVSSCHLAVIRFAFNNVNPAHITHQHAPTWQHSDQDLHIFKQVGATMLPIECLHAVR